MYKVLHLMDSADIGGMSAVLLYYYQYIDRERFHFDLLLTSPSSGRNEGVLRDMGCQVARIPPWRFGRRDYAKALEKYLRENHYDAIHVHQNSISYAALRVAKKVGVPCRIAHSHTTAPSTGYREEIRRLLGCLLNPCYATQVIGCGKWAGDRVFGKHTMRTSRAHVLLNAVDTARFGYQPEVRDQVRRELALEGKFALGMVGRLATEKNTLFPIRFLPQLCEKMPQACLLYAGGGPQEEAIRREAASCGVEDRVHLLGKRDDVERIYQALDVLLMPSFHEGFPLSAVEAMASGLPVMLSEHITDELSFGSAVRYLPLDAPEKWISAIQEAAQKQDRAIRQSEIKANGLDIHDTVKRLERIYLKDIERTKEKEMGA